jgi:hypothetical protein
MLFQKQVQSASTINQTTNFGIAEMENETSEPINEEIHQPNIIGNEDSEQFHEPNPNKQLFQNEFDYELESDAAMNDEESKHNSPKGGYQTQVQHYLKDQKKKQNQKSDPSHEVDPVELVKQQYELMLHKQNKIHSEEIQALKMQMQ